MLGSMTYKQVLAESRSIPMAFTDRAKTFRYMLNRAVDCGKTVYRKRKYAQSAAEKMLVEFGSEQEPYECYHCHFWHLRSQEKRTKRHTRIRKQQRRNAKERDRLGTDRARGTSVAATGMVGNGCNGSDDDRDREGHQQGDGR